MLYSLFIFFFFFTDTSTTEIYTLSLHDALPIYPCLREYRRASSTAIDASLKPVISDYIAELRTRIGEAGFGGRLLDRKSTRLNSSHMSISYAVFCLKKKKT